MGFDRKNFIDFIASEFSFDGKTHRIIDNLVEYGMKNLDNYEGQLVNFIYDVVDDPIMEEIKQFEIMEEKTMNYDEMRKTMETMVNENHVDFTKALISVEKGIYDEQALDVLYNQYMENDSMSLLNDEFDYMIDDLRENGQIKEIEATEKEDNDLINIVGNVVGEVDIVERENKSGETFKVVNFFVVSKDDEGNKIYHNCSAYEDKGDIPKDFKQGDFVKLFGQIRTSIDDNGKEHSNVRILSSKLLKAKEQTKGNEEKKESVLGAIKKFKEEEKVNKKETKVTQKETER